ncbi:MAG TPA: DUF4019 domain-containing protein [Steroidobacteraceae bacterium]|nr:DUF4019 domain-containing protein [Steroidobacteraceae bacterium]
MRRKASRLAGNGHAVYAWRPMRPSTSRRATCWKLFCAVLPAFWATAALAQDFHPYADGQVTEAQWQSYFDEVRAKLGASERSFEDEHLVVFEDPSRQLYFAFTLPGHPAHPAWIGRRVYSEGGEAGTEQVGYYAGDRAQFEALYESYQRLTQRMQGDDEREQPPEADSPELRAAVEELTQDYLVAHDAGDFERAYAMLSPTLQQLSPYTDWREHAAAALVRFGKPQGHDILKITWYQNPPTAVLPGTYAAVDLRCHYERLAICNEVLLVRREKNGEFRISRHDQNALDDEMLLEMCKRKDRAHIEFGSGSPVDVSCPRR